jgi:hypothetical protein
MLASDLTDLKVLRMRIPFSGGRISIQNRELARESLALSSKE